MFAHLHLHTEYSLLDGACRIKRLLDMAQARGDKAVAITDHGVMYGAVEFYKEAKKRGIRPIIGCEVYVAQRSRFDKVHELDGEHRHLVLLCENNEGYRNLAGLVSRAWLEGFYSKPRVDFELLRQYHEGLIALSACLAGEIPRALLANDYEEAKAAAMRYEEIFGKGNFYLELQDHGLREQKYVNPQLIRLSRELDIPLVATNDCHYITREDSEMHRILLCIQTNHTVEEENGLAFDSQEFYYKSEEEMRALFPDVPEAIDNTGKIAGRCQVELEFGKTKLPKFEAPGGEDNRAYFYRLCEEGLHRRYGENPPENVRERLAYEQSVIEKMGYINYYLIVYDFIRYARSVDIPVGPGRGSGAGSLAAYCLGITSVDPIRYHLLFERFLNPERVSMPDFDVDFSDERRPEMIEYVVRKYGSDHVAQIVTFGTMAARGSLRDVGRAMAIPYAVVDSVAKLVPMEPNITLDAALEKSQEFRQRCESDPQIARLVEMAKKVEGMPRNASTHAAGVVITDQPVRCLVPLAKNGDSIVTQYTMTTLEELGLLKIDFLGLRNLSVIHDAVEQIRRREPSFRIEEIRDDDPAVYAMLSAGRMEGVFQFESGGMRNVIMQLKPESIEDLIAVVSLYRPGPMQSIPRYIECRHNPSMVRYKHPLLKDILEVTYGCIVYQEQVMQIFRVLAGYSLGRADIVRRAMSKKKADVMERERQIFVHGLVREDGTVEVEGCIRRGVDEKTALDIFREMESFSAYGFNKSHAAPYALVSYQTAWLKCHYPKEYMAALLTSVLDNTNKLVAYMAECSRLGIRVLPPHVNQSGLGFTVSGQNIRFGLLAVKNLGKGFLQHIILNREQAGPFRSFQDFCRRVYDQLNRRALESLIKCGALDGLGLNRRQMLENAGAILDYLEEDKRRNIEGQLGFFSSGEEREAAQEFSVRDMPDFSQREKLAYEKEVTGMYLSGHPMAAYQDQYDKLHATPLGDLLAEDAADRFPDGSHVSVIGIVTSMKMKTTKNGSTMAFLVLEDLYGSLEVLVFPSTLSEFGAFLAEGEAVLLTARVSIREEEDAKLICEAARPLRDLSKQGEGTPRKRGNRPGLYLKVPSSDSPRCKRALLLVELFEGATPVYLYRNDVHKLFSAPASLRVSVNETLLTQLRHILGEKNVAVVEK